MDPSFAIFNLTYLHDLKILGSELPVPENLKNVKISRTILEKYPQSFSTRCMRATLYLTYQEFKKNTPISYSEFEAVVMRSKKGQEEFQKMLQKVSATIPRTIQLADIQALQQS